MSRKLSRFANYCDSRSIIVLFQGSNLSADMDSGVLYFEVRWPGLSGRVRSNFESKIREDNHGYTVNVLYKELRHKDREVVLSLT